MRNPYPASPAGKKAGRPVIGSVIKAPDGTVLVFDTRGEQLPEYQGRYPEVRARLLREAPPDTIFSYARDYQPELQAVPRNDW